MRAITRAGVFCDSTRLVVDSNRPLDRAEAFVTQNEVVSVRGSEAMTAMVREVRAEIINRKLSAQGPA